MRSSRVPDLFTRFGGHSHAVGFSLPSANLPELRTRLDDYARSRLTLADFDPSLNFDAELALDQVTPEFFSLLQRLEPFRRGKSPAGFHRPRRPPHGLAAQS